MALSQKERDALPADHFAVPGKRALPINDEEHTRLAWDMVEHTHDLSEGERSEARTRILRRAKELGISTADWDHHTVHAMCELSAMAIEMPDVPDHPNRIPFSGVMTLLDEPSDNPVGGAKGKRIIIPKRVAEAALPSLLGMGVNYSPKLDKHDPQKKIGVITDAWIEGNELHIRGFLYGADFPAVVDEIKAKKDKLGFSYEAQGVAESWKVDPAVLTHCIFTGAAILLKDKAAYTSTSLEASASQEIENMTKEELEALIAGAVGKAVSEATAPLNAQIAELKASNEKLTAAAEVHEKVKPHAEAVRAAAEGLRAAGIGLHPEQGHVVALHKLADNMEAEAVLGKLPHIYRDHGWLTASAENINSDSEKLSADLKASQDEVASLKAELEDTKQKLFASAENPRRKTAVSNHPKGENGGPESLDDMRKRLKAEGKSGRDIAVALTAHAFEHNLEVGQPAAA